MDAKAFYGNFPGLSLAYIRDPRGRTLEVSTNLSLLGKIGISLCVLSALVIVGLAWLFLFFTIVLLVVVAVKRVLQIESP